MSKYNLIGSNYTYIYYLLETMEGGDSNANIYMDKLDKLVLSMIDLETESDTETPSSEDEVTNFDESDGDKSDESEDQTDVEYEKVF